MNNEEYKISIIVPVYNVEKYLSQCLDSLINQTMKEIEIICVNDGSKDKSLEILNEYAAKDERLVILDQQNSGVSVARNNALKHIRGEYYMFVDSDDWLDLDTCEVAYSYAMNYKAEILMFSYTKEFGDHSIENHVFQQPFINYNDKENLSNFHRRLVGPIGGELSNPQDADKYASCWMQLFKSCKFKDCKFKDIRELGTFEDGLYQIEVYKDCESFVYIDRPFYHYRKTNSSSITSKYKPDLFKKWQHLYDIMTEELATWRAGETYRKALQSRIAIGCLGIGLNQISSNLGNIKNAQILKEYLSDRRYRDALKSLNTSPMGLPWKLFFFLCNHRLCYSLVILLTLIEYLRTHKK